MRSKHVVLFLIGWFLGDVVTDLSTVGQWQINADDYIVTVAALLIIVVLEVGRKREQS